MGSLTIRNIDDNVINALKAQADANNRSLEAGGPIRTDPGESTSGPASRDFASERSGIFHMTPKGPQTDSVELLREDRDR